MKVTFLLASFPRLPIGGYRVVYEHANGLAARGHDVAVVHCRGTPGQPEPKGWQAARTWAGFHWRRWTRQRPAWIAIDPRVRLEIVADPGAGHVPDGDVVIGTAWFQAPFLAGYPASKGKPAYLFQHYETWSGPKHDVDRTWSAPFAKAAVSRWLVEIGGTLGARDVAYVPNGLDFRLFSRRRDFEGRGPVVSTMYSAQEWKGWSDAREALVRAKDAVPGLRAVVFGVSRPREALPDWMELVVDPRPEALAEIYNQSGVFLCASHAEGFALPPAEAMACGAAVVTTDCGGNRDYAVDGETALVAPPRRPAALAERLVQALESEALRSRLARGGCERIREFTWERSHDAMAAFLERARSSVAVGA